MPMLTDEQVAQLRIRERLAEIKTYGVARTYVDSGYYSSDELRKLAADFDASLRKSPPVFTGGG